MADPLENTVLRQQGKYLLGTVLAVAALPAFAAPANPDHGDTAWLLVSSALVLFMCLPGLAVFYGGLVRRKNVLSVLAQCFAVTCVVSVLWLFIGFPLAFGSGSECNEWICVISGFTSTSALRGVLHGTVPAAAFMLFQMTFAVIAPVLSLGGFAERMRFPAVLAYTALGSIVV